MAMNRRLTATFFLLAVLAAVPFLAARPTVPPPPAPPRPVEPARLDWDGERLPAGAISRAGTLRFRSGSHIGQIAFAPDGQTVYTTGNILLYATGTHLLDKFARSWAVADGRELRRFGGTGIVSTVAVSPDGKFVATGENGNVVRLWDAKTGTEFRRLAAHLRVSPAQDDPDLHAVHWLRFGPGGRTLLAAYYDGNAIIEWNLEQGKESQRLTGEGVASTISLSDDGSRLAVGTFTGHVTVWELATGRRLWMHTMTEGKVNAGELPVHALALSRDGNRLIFCDNAAIHIWDVDREQEDKKIRVARGIHRLAMSPSGTALAVAYADVDRGGKAAILDPRTGNELHELDWHGRGMYALAFSPDGTTLATGGEGHTVQFWDVGTGKERPSPAGHASPITTTSLSADGRLLATCSDHDRAVRLWDTATGRELRRIEGHDSGVEEVALSLDGRLLASAAGDVVHISDTASGRMLHDLERHPALGPLLRFSDDGQTLATASRGNSVALWDCATGKRIREMPAPPGGLSALLTFHDGRLLGYEAAPADHEESEAAIHLWDVTANRLVRRFAGHPMAVASIILSPNGRMLASRGPDKTIRVWEVATGGERCRFQEPGDNQRTMSWTGTQFLAFSPDGRMLVSGASDDPFARRWDLATGKELPPLTGHRSWIGTVEFSANGRVLVTGSQDTTCLVWDGSAVAPPLRPPVRLTDGELARCWDDFKDHDAAKAYQAILNLAGAGDQATTWIGARVKPPTAVDRVVVARWIEALDDPQYAVRERATAALMRVADQAEEALRGALERTRSPEAQRRIGRLLEVAHDVAPTPDRLLELRAVEVLEMVDTAAARQRLSAIAAGPAGANLSRESLAALRRLGGSPPAPR